MSKKKAKSIKNPLTTKIPRIASSFKNPMDLYPAWHVEFLDPQGPWGWTEIDRDYFFSDIIPKIVNFEKMYWKDILNRNNHEVSVSEVCKDARKRLMYLNLDDIETLVSLRLTGKQRVWGIRVENIFKVLWWDPEHKVYPSKLKHT